MGTTAPNPQYSSSRADWKLYLSTVPLLHHNFDAIRSHTRATLYCSNWAAGAFADLCKTAQLVITHEKERLLVMQIVRFSEALSDAIADLVPNRITDYLYELTDIFNSFYVECPVCACSDLS